MYKRQVEMYLQASVQNLEMVGNSVLVLQVMEVQVVSAQKKVLMAMVLL